MKQVVGSVTQIVTEGTGEGGQRVTGARTRPPCSAAALNRESDDVSARSIAGVVVEDESGATQTLPAATVVNCAGPWAGAAAAMHGLDLPVVPRLRFVYQVACDDPRYAPSVRTQCDTWECCTGVAQVDLFHFQRGRVRMVYSSQHHRRVINGLLIAGAALVWGHRTKIRSVL